MNLRPVTTTPPLKWFSALRTNIEDKQVTAPTFQSLRIQCNRLSSAMDSAPEQLQAMRTTAGHATATNDGKLPPRPSHRSLRSRTGWDNIQAYPTVNVYILSYRKIYKNTVIIMHKWRRYNNREIRADHACESPQQYDRITLMNHPKSTKNIVGGNLPWLLTVQHPGGVITQIGIFSRIFPSILGGVEHLC